MEGRLAQKPTLCVCFFLGRPNYTRYPLRTRQQHPKVANGWSIQLSAHWWKQAESHKGQSSALQQWQATSESIKNQFRTYTCMRWLAWGVAGQVQRESDAAVCWEDVAIAIGGSRPPFAVLGCSFSICDGSTFFASFGLRCDIIPSLQNLSFQNDPFSCS